MHFNSADMQRESEFSDAKSNYYSNWIWYFSSFSHAKRYIDGLKDTHNNPLKRTLYPSFSMQIPRNGKLLQQQQFKLSHKMWVMRLLVIEITWV